MSTETQTSAHDVLDDPLGGSTRSAKRLMLVFSCISLLIVFTGVSPDEVSVFGLKFPGLTLSVFNTGLLWMFGISIFSFIIYGTSDFFRHKRRLDVYNHCRANDVDSAILTDPASYEAQEQQFHEDEFTQMTGYKSFEIPHAPTKVLVFLRLSIDLYFPVIFAVFCFILFIIRHVI